MRTQDYRATYRVAMQEATADLDEIYREVEELQVRREMIVQVLEAIEPLVLSTAVGSYQDHRPDPVTAQPVRSESMQVEPANKVAAPVAAAPIPISEPVAPAPFAPVPDIIVDPIQSRINRALGLAVA